MNASIGLDWSSRLTPTQAAWLAAPVALSVSLFYIDLHAPDRMIFGLPYLLVVIVAQAIAGGSAATLGAAIAALLVVVAPFLTSNPVVIDPGWMAFVGRGTVVAAIGMMVVFLRQRDAARESLREQVGALENTSTQRSDELRLVSAQLHREIAERRRAELRSGYLASIVESSADAIIGQSLDGTIVSWNAGASRVYGRKREDVIGKAMSVLVPGDRRKEFTDTLARVVKGDRVDDLQSLRLRGDGSTVPVSAAFSPILDEKGTIVGVSVIERDITRRLQSEQSVQGAKGDLEDKLRQASQELESAFGEIEAFGHTVSRDLREPLRSLNGFVNDLVEEAGDRFGEEDLVILGRIHGAARRMERTIDDLLSLSKAGDHPIDSEVVNLGDISRAMIEDLRASAPARKVEWEVGSGLLAWGDAGLLKLVVRNLLGYSFRHTGHLDVAHVAIGVELRGSDSVTYFVRDDGPGFESGAPGEEPGAFSRVQRGSGEAAAGAGLAAVERIVRRHGGTVSAEELADGVIFRFRLPVPKRARVQDGDDDFSDPATA